MSGISRELFNLMKKEFEKKAEMVSKGLMSPLDAAIDFSEEQKMFEELMTARRDWCSEFSGQIEDEARKYPNNVYRGYTFKQLHKSTYDFKNIPKWVEMNKQLKDYEREVKTNYTESLGFGRYDSSIPFPSVKVSNYLKVKKADEKGKGR